MVCMQHMCTLDTNLGESVVRTCINGYPMMRDDNGPGFGETTPQWSVVQWRTQGPVVSSPVANTRPSGQ